MPWKSARREARAPTPVLLQAVAHIAMPWDGLCIPPDYAGPYDRVHEEYAAGRMTMGEVMRHLMRWGDAGRPMALR